MVKESVIFVDLIQNTQAWVVQIGGEELHHCVDTSELVIGFGLEHWVRVALF